MHPRYKFKLSYGLFRKKMRYFKGPFVHEQRGYRYERFEDGSFSITEIKDWYDGTRFDRIR